MTKKAFDKIAAGLNEALAMAEDEGEDAGKRDKSSVNYRDATGSENCHNCRYSYGPKDDRRCKRVKGQIYPDDVCDLWEAKRA